MGRHFTVLNVASVFVTLSPLFTSCIGNYPTFLPLSYRIGKPEYFGPPTTDQATLEHETTHHHSHQDGHCPPKFDRVGSDCFYFAEEKRNWWNSMLACWEDDARLATFDDPHSFNEYVLQTHGEDQLFWVGGKREYNGTAFEFPVGQEVPLDFPWSHGYPDSIGHCLAIGYQGGFVNDVCDQHWRYICHTPLLEGPPPHCQFPFIWRGGWYTEACATTGDVDGIPWCSTKTDEQHHHIPGNWKHCQNEPWVGHGIVYPQNED
ncbi:unnamed protein product [Meganyctiphanes norvegica]|uniref:C-type lectin n=1 Tax=Meganyctiphanes norvegica TaxID=48144 RepID=A0AAV2RWB0_MEGNR